ncbi:sugar lactone lactonase YvrE [Paraburkholderia sp. BL8N3]|jgi:sugar lactone lactonase YvrE|nr:SMP-30/gluconolactonase/LRE family protein [Paraburkholderia sp. BL8N3]TCK35397.1 sugar lactone lactonase YvrE [Paraburkholderia sp. BL8N3]
MTVSSITRPIDMVGSVIDVVDSTPDVLGESIIWDEKTQLLWWVDGIGQAIHRLDISSGAKKSWPMQEEIGSIGLRAKGGLIVGMRSGFYFFSPETGELTEIARPDAERPKNRFNDGKTDRHGRYWSGTVEAAAYTPRGRLFRLDPDLKPHLIMEGITCINGISFSPDNRLMYMTDSFSCQIDVFDYDSVEGAIHNRRKFADVPLGRGICDGSTVDADGCFWSANMDGWCVTRYDPRGRIDMVVNLPVRRVSSLCFGGPDLDTLFITTARRRMSEKELTQQPLAGNVLAVRPGVKGLPEPEFLG